jgi:hypothetical protein
MATAFISYSTKNKSRATKLAFALKEKGVNVWFAEWNMLIGRSLADQIYEGIRSSDFLLVILTKHSINSSWVQRELHFASILELEQRSTFVIPLLYEKCKIPDSLLDKVYADFSKSFESGFNGLLQVIKGKIADINFLAKPELEVYVVMFLLNITTSLRELILYYNKIFYIEAQKRKTFINNFCTDMDIFINYAKSNNIPYKCWEWIEWYKNSIYSGNYLLVDENKDIEIKRTPLKKYLYGRPLFIGGITKNLSLLQRIVLEIGKRLDGCFDDEKKTKELREKCIELYTLFNFSEQFLYKVNQPILKDELFSLILYELKHYNDYNWLVWVYNALMNPKAVQIAFTLTYYLPFRVGTDKFLTNNETVIEFLISELGAVDEAFNIMEAAYEVTSGTKPENKKKDKNGWSKNDWIIYYSYMKSWASLKNKAQKEKDKKESVRWFLLTLNLGQLFFSKGMQHLMVKPVGMSILNNLLIEEIEQITNQIVKDSNLNKKINEFVHNVFYSKSIKDTNIENEFLDLIAEMANSCYDSSPHYKK